MIIHPEIFITPDRPVIQFRLPKEQVNLDVELPKILYRQGWGCGTYFHIQFVNHERNKVFSQAQFMVTEVVESLHTTDNEYNPNTKTIYVRKWTQIGPWFPTEDTRRSGSELVKSIDKDAMRIKWNPGLKKFQVIVDGKSVFENADKTQVEEFLKTSKAA